ncbi:MAG: response regulator transcription factor [Kofleriaceae bacterium]
MRALIVEDYAPVRTAVRDGLLENGFAVDVASDGEDGLWLAEQNPYDVVILDVMLPKLSGLDVLRRLRGAGSSTAVLLLTARDTVADRVEGLDLGADDYLVKPFAFAELLARVRALVRRSYDKTRAAIEVSDLVIDTTRRLVRRGGRPIALSAREYALLEYLAMRAGQLVTRTEIWDHVYDFNADVQSNVIDVYIGYLRKKLGPPPLIHTRRGHGYLLGVE